MFICDIPNNLLVDNIFFSQDKSGFNQFQDSLCYFGTRKLNILEKEIADLDNQELQLWNDCYLTYQNLIPISQLENLTIDDLMIHEILKDLEISKMYFLRSQIIICNFSKLKYFETKLYKVFRPFNDIIETKDFNMKDFQFLFEINIHKFTIDFFFIDLVNNTQSIEKRNYLLLYLSKQIVIHQNKGGLLILKIKGLDNDNFLKEYIYLISGWYQDVLIVKPSISNFLENQCFIVAKNFYLTNMYKLNYLNQVVSFLSPFSNTSEYHCNSFLKNPFSLVYTDRILENRMVFGQIYMELLEFYLSLLKNKNKEEKLTSHKINNAIKCENWIEKYLPVVEKN